MAAPLAPFANQEDAQTALDTYTLAHGGGSERQSGAGRRAMPELRKKHERATQCLETILEGAFWTQSMWEGLVRNAIPCVQTLREVALKAKKKSDVDVGEEFEQYVCCFAQQLTTLIATYIPQSEGVLRHNLRAIVIKEWLIKLWETETDKPRPEYNAAMCFTTSEEKLQEVFGAVRFEGSKTMVKVCHVTGVDFTWLKESAQAFQTTVKINADAGWITCSRCLEGYQSCKRDARCDCELLCEDQEKGCLEDGEAEGCVLIEVKAPFHVKPDFLCAMYRAHWLPLVYN